MLHPLFRGQQGLREPALQVLQVPHLLFRDQRGLRVTQEAQGLPVLLEARVELGLQDLPGLQVWELLDLRVLPVLLAELGLRVLQVLG